MRQNTEESKQTKEDNRTIPKKLQNAKCPMSNIAFVFLFVFLFVCPLLDDDRLRGGKKVMACCCIFPQSVTVGWMQLT